MKKINVCYVHGLLEKGIRTQFHRGAVVGSKFERPI